MSLLDRFKPRMIDPERALPGRDQAMRVPERHTVLGNPLTPPFPEGFEQAVFGMGCFWGAERSSGRHGVWTTAVGYAGGYTPNPTYQEVCSGSTGHAEVGAGRIRPRPGQLRGPAEDLLGETRPHAGHAPGQRHGHAVPLGIYSTTPEQQAAAEAVARACTRRGSRRRLRRDHHRDRDAAGPFYYAEDYHQQYLDKNPDGYCGLRRHRA